MSLPYALISLDLDLTLLDAHHRISPRNLAAVHRCRDLGAQIVITSGRMYFTTLPYLRAMEVDSPVIAYNGAFIKQESTGDVLLNAHLDMDTTRELVEWCAREELPLQYYLHDTLYTAKASPWSDLYASRTGAAVNVVGDLRVFADQPPTKLLIVNEPARINALLAELQPHFAGRAYVTISNAEYLEFMPPDVNKGKALAVVAEHFGVPRERVIAFGDAGNDVPALAWAGLGVAMDNARPETKAIADRIAPRYDEDGVAVVLEEIFGFAPACL